MLAVPGAAVVVVDVGCPGVAVVVVDIGCPGVAVVVLDVVTRLAEVVTGSWY